ncbi:MAG: hypothetical protein VKJ64_16905 [Leptolyngbyaceae bacterium]|nr:hypothetical protein [Leptolyngbyaceae bacterium]
MSLLTTISLHQGCCPYVVISLEGWAIAPGLSLVDGLIQAQAAITVPA